ncbi:MAG TPA: M1 family aminopeptidase [Terracidiphilus sp.]|nr:M1 family aminopeptidase [Terracidiphilus sp.]
MSFLSAFTFRKQILAALAAALLVPFSASAQRLSGTVVPEHYTLTLTPDLKAATFSGVESIEISVKQPTASITLNSAEIQFQSVEISAAGKTQAATVSLNKNDEQATFTVPNEIPAGNATLSIHYTGILNDELRGFYLSKTERRNYAVTQFEPTDARRAFPSFDEPAFKATFDISLVVDKGDTAISNGPIVKDTPGPEADKHTLKFLTTPRMSTYLVAFLVGDFKCTSGSQDGVAIRVCATPDKVNLTPYGVDVAKYVLHYYNNYFGIPYPLKKLDLIALPDFEAGAMENFGAITYRETALLIDPKTASVGAKKNVAEVIAHEMAHQWFGDLVTMQWWNNIWLNEGFATWMENKPVAAMHPEWNIDQDVAANMDNTLNLDAQPTTRAIRATADTRAEINQMFDGISYGKASDVLLSVENYVGEETFRRGVQKYLKAHLYGNATAEDFWNAQTAVSHKPVDKIMESLVAQPGVPLVTFGQPENGMVSVSQRRFYLTPSITPNPEQKWTIPVCFKTSTGQQCDLLTPTTTSLKVPAGALFFANAGGKGYYRSAYAPASYSALLSHVESDLTPPERINLIGDQWAQLRDNKTSIAAYLDLAQATKADSNADVIDAAVGGVAALYERIAETPKEKAALEAWTRNTYDAEYKKLPAPKDGESPNITELRATLFGTLGSIGKDPQVLTEARSIAEKYLANPASINPSLGNTALALAARNGDAALFDRLQHIYETSNEPDMQERALQLLALFENPKLAERALELAVSDKVRNQDAAIVIAISLSERATRDTAWKFIENNWEKVHAQLTTASGSYVVNAASSFCSDQARDNVEKFFSSHKVDAADVALRHTVEHINGCIEQRALLQPSLRSWMDAQPGCNKTCASSTKTAGTFSGGLSFSAISQCRIFRMGRPRTPASSHHGPRSNQSRVIVLSEKYSPAASPPCIQRFGSTG